VHQFAVPLECPASDVGLVLVMAIELSKLSHNLSNLIRFPSQFVWKSPSSKHSIYGFAFALGCLQTNAVYCELYESSPDRAAKHMRVLESYAILCSCGHLGDPATKYTLDQLMKYCTLFYDQLVPLQWRGIWAPQKQYEHWCK